MVTTTNPRKIGSTAGMTYVSIPDKFLAESGLEQGDRVVLTTDGQGFTVEKVEWRTA